MIVSTNKAYRQPDGTLMSDNAYHRNTLYAGLHQMMESRTDLRVVRRPHGLRHRGEEHRLQPKVPGPPQLLFEGGGALVAEDRGRRVGIDPGAHAAHDLQRGAERGTKCQMGHD